jgi:ankyrin repeat protein
MKGHETVVELLLEKGADLECKSNYGETPLCQAAQNGHEAVVRLLLERGAGVECKPAAREGRQETSTLEKTEKALLTV